MFFPSLRELLLTSVSMKQEAENKQTNLNVDEPNHHFQSKFEKNSSHQGEVLHGKPGSQATVRTTYQARRPQDPSAPVMQEVTEGEEPKGQAEATGRGQGRPRSGDQLTTRRGPSPCSRLYTFQVTILKEQKWMCWQRVYSPLPQKY